MIYPLKGEPLTVLVMPKIIVSEHMFDVNNPRAVSALYCILFSVFAQYIERPGISASA